MINYNVCVSGRHCNAPTSQKLFALLLQQQNTVIPVAIIVELCAIAMFTCLPLFCIQLHIVLHLVHICIPAYMYLQWPEVPQKRHAAIYSTRTQSLLLASGLQLSICISGFSLKRGSVAQRHTEKWATPSFP